jgi:SAM-dependent methyltransferase
MAATRALPPAAAAFDQVAPRFDERFGPWLSVAAQRRAVRRRLAAAFPLGASVLEIGGGTGEDAAWLMDQGRRVFLTDASPSMVAVASRKLAGRAYAEVWPAEEMEALAAERESRGETPFDGAFSNFAALNCVSDLRPVARGLARLLKPGAPALLVLFGPFPPAEVVTELARRNPSAAFRRLAKGDVAARLGGRDFTVRYHRPREIARAFAPWFRPHRTRGIGVFVPPSAAEPWISRHPRLLSVLETLDRAVEAPLALLGDHVLYHLVRTGVSPSEEGGR